MTVDSMALAAIRAEPDRDVFHADFSAGLTLPDGFDERLAAELDRRIKEKLNESA